MNPEFAKAMDVPDKDVIAELRKENDILRAWVAKHGDCVYGHRLPSGVCTLGYPGCACADDIMCAEETYLKDLLERLRKAEAAAKVP